ncbi:MAG: hypothetical protein ACN6P5_08845 [Pseudomonas protegens]
MDKSVGNLLRKGFLLHQERDLPTSAMLCPAPRAANRKHANQA